MKQRGPIVIGISIVVLVILNGICLNTVWRTQISWLLFFTYSIPFSIPVWVIIYFSMIRKAQANNLTKLLLSAGLGYFLYLIAFSTLPYVYNYFWSEDDLQHYTTNEFEMVRSVDEDESGLDVVTWDCVWYHNGNRFRLDVPHGGVELHYFMSEGALGYPVVKDWHLE